MSEVRAVMLLPIAEIAVGDRVGFFHPNHAARLGENMATDRQHDPIHVRRNGNRAAQDWTLVAGLHRLRGMEAAGRADIEAIQVADATSSAAELLRLELSENLDHRSPRPIERAIFIAARARMEEALDYPNSVGEPRADRAARARWDASITMIQASEPRGAEASDLDGHARWNAAAVTAAASNWQARAAAALGCSVPSLKRYLALQRALVEPLPELAQALNAHPLAENLTGLLRIASLKNVEARRRAIDVMIADPDIPNFDAVLVRAELHGSKGNRFEAVEENRFERGFWSNLERLNLSQLRGVISTLPERLTPGIRKTLVLESIDRASPEERVEIALASLAGLGPQEREAVGKQLAVKPDQLTPTTEADHA